jgi:hypothetical protein
VMKHDDPRSITLTSHLHTKQQPAREPGVLCYFYS